MNRDEWAQGWHQERRWVADFEWHCARNYGWTFWFDHGDELI